MDRLDGEPLLECLRPPPFGDRVLTGLHQPGFDLLDRHLRPGRPQLEVGGEPQLAR